MGCPESTNLKTLVAKAKFLVTLATHWVQFQALGKQRYRRLPTPNFENNGLDVQLRAQH